MRVWRVAYITMYVALYNTDNLLPLERGERERERVPSAPRGIGFHTTSVFRVIFGELFFWNLFAFGRLRLIGPRFKGGESRLYVFSLPASCSPPPPSVMSPAVTSHCGNFPPFHFPPRKRLSCPTRRMCARAYPLNGPEAGWQTFCRGLSLFTYRTQARHHSPFSLLHRHRDGDLSYAAATQCLLTQWPQRVFLSSGTLHI